MEQSAVLFLRGYLEDYLRQKGLPVRKAFRCLHPDHEDKHPSMCYNAKAQNVHCFSCGTTYDVFDLVGMDYGLPTFPEQLQKVGALFGLAVDTPSARDKLHVVGGGKGGSVVRKKPPRPDSRQAALDALRQEAADTYDYFGSRGISPQLCMRYGLFQTGDRAYFPVVEGGSLTGWCARALRDDVQPRYQNSAGALGIWNGDLLSGKGGGAFLFVTEGILDALSLEEMGHRAVALCGAQNGGKLLERCRGQAASLAGWRFVLCGDGDKAGQAMNEKLKTGLEALGLTCQVLTPPEGEDWNSLLVKDREGLQTLLHSLSKEGDTAPSYNASSAAGLLDGMLADCRRRGGRDAVATGFAALDKLLDGGLYPGLYVMGAISSLGKTSLALQMADYIAGNEGDVLFITLEQSRYELMAKSLSRISAELDPDLAFSAREILSGTALEGSLHRRQLLESCREAYSQCGGSLFFREGLCDIGAGEIRAMVREHVEARGRAPMVIVDYLQILQPADSRATDKQNVDRSVVELKRLSRDFDIPVLCISSFNRENYRTAVSMEAFKESGAVEYSADVLLGLQLQGAGEKGFDGAAAKLKSPRALELVILKNRSGLPYAKVSFRYDAKFNRFWESKQLASARFA